MKAIDLIIHELNLGTPFSGWKDSSYKNDACESVTYVEGVQIFIPNTSNPDPDDCEEFDTFSLQIEDVYSDDCEITEFTVPTLGALVAKINEQDVKTSILKVKRSNRKHDLARERKHVHDRLKQVEGTWSHSNINTHGYIEALIEGLRDLQKSDF